MQFFQMTLPLGKVARYDKTIYHTQSKFKRRTSLKTILSIPLSLIKNISSQISMVHFRTLKLHITSCILQQMHFWFIPNLTSSLKYKQTYF